MLWSGSLDLDQHRPKGIGRILGHLEEHIRERILSSAILIGHKADEMKIPIFFGAT